MPAVVLAAWAWRLISHRGLPWFWVNLVMTPVLLAAFSGFLAGLEVPESWPMAGDPGGIIGDGVRYGIVNLTAWLPAAPPSWSVTLALGLIGLFTLALSLGIEIGEWRTVGRGAVNAARNPAAPSVLSAPEPLDRGTRRGRCRGRGARAQRVARDGTEGARPGGRGDGRAGAHHSRHQSRPESSAA